MKKQYTLTILGCGSSPGVPTIESGWGNCDPTNPKNIRSRTSALLSVQTLDKAQNINNTKFNILFDIGPDFRQQALANNIKQIDTILLTHQHADHIYGIDDLRSINRIMNKSIPLYANPETITAINKTHYYIFEYVQTVNNPYRFYKTSLEQNTINPYDTIVLNEDISIQATLQNHGRIDSLGFVIDKKFAYITDFVTFSNKTMNLYKNLELIVISGVTLKPHHSHMGIFQVIELLKILKPKQAIITHMSEQLDYNYLLTILPKHVTPAHDGLIINF